MTKVLRQWQSPAEAQWDDFMCHILVIARYCDHFLFQYLRIRYRPWMNECIGWRDGWMNEWMPLIIQLSLFNPMQPECRSRQFPHLWAPAVFHLRRQLVTRWAPKYFFRGLCFCSSNNAQTSGKQGTCTITSCVLRTSQSLQGTKLMGYMLFGTFIFTSKAHGWNWSRSDGLPKSAAKSFKEVWFVAVVPKESPEIPGDQMQSWFLKWSTFDCES